VSRQLLPRPATRTTNGSGRGKPTTRTGATAGSGTTQAPAGVLRRPIVIALVAGGAVVVAGLGWTFLSSSGTTADVPASGLVRPSASARPSSAIETAAAAEPTTGAVSRDPFADEAAPSVTAPTTSPPPLSTGPTASEAAPAKAPPPVTVTVTATDGPTYVGLYAWNGSRASFRVNARAYSVAVGAHFGTGLQFTAVVPGRPKCARLTHGGDSFTLCPGQVATVS
jgi:hypothetical protein